MFTLFVFQKWVPRFGYKKVAAEKEKDWAVPVPGNAPPMEDQFVKKSSAKKERIAKNEFQRLRNIASAKKIAIPRTGIIKTSTSKEVSCLILLKLVLVIYDQQPFSSSYSLEE